MNTHTQDTCTEIVLFKAKPGVSRERMLRAARFLQTWVAAQPGYVARTLLEDADKGTWVDIVTWRSAADAKAAAANFGDAGCLREIEATMEPDMTMLHAATHFRA